MFRPQRHMTDELFCALQYINTLHSFL